MSHHDPIQNAQMLLGAGLMELRIHDERRSRIVSRIERAYATIIELVSHGSDDPQLVVDEA